MLDKKNIKYKDFLAKIKEINEKYTDLEIIKDDKKYGMSPTFVER